ncbi:thiamine/thiamine pyrophosphate ABC transporter permease ThiP [Falsirhodobacter sp. 20TX0035]|uniref:thiamine/thiamine pyrophosphate ABC transporter permease ThiP n=1 Tax=Falsirhodobacter sp. 20TX0035 TaxID=3022019 RepID=UPI00232C0E84|nr:thiamine/thiamine pyrophosphate ABC transporter permease ThiP [Falsirhodobacter sp. 20TX0035]MDB6452813.1 thiamine/thiamine pyrophosphate ABC transporter permease ThiP [Falsirhodobacter sp. 20TX0035]
MAGRAVPLTVGLAVLLLTFGPLAMVAAHAQGGWGADGPALRFTVLQAALSAVISVALAVPVARALARRHFRGRGALIALLGAPFLLPVIVAVLGLLAVFGRAGLVNQALGTVGLSIPIYGLHGVVLAHVFLNMPLAVRLILQGWQAIPAERMRLALSLGLGPRDIARHLERPMLKAVLPGTLAVIFAICLTSFAVALTLGGGPRATTVELAIYQSLRFQFDLGRAASLAALQFLLCAAAVLLAGRFAAPSGFGRGLDRVIPFAPAGWRRSADAAVLTLATLFLAVPLAMVAWRGLAGLGDLPPSVWGAAARSVGLALGATALTLGAALTLALSPARWAGVVATLPLAASSLVMGTGLFLALWPLLPPERVALPVTLVVNATLALPFAFRILHPAAQTLRQDYGRLADSLGLRGMARLRWLVLPRLRAPLGFAAGVSAALSMGDLGVIALFAAPDGPTLPLLVQQLMGAYRMEQAAGAALLLVVLSFALFFIFDWGGRRGSDL